VSPFLSNIAVIIDQEIDCCKVYIALPGTFATPVEEEKPEKRI